MTELEQETSYHGNPNLKPIGLPLQFTPEQIQEIVKCQQDPIYFIENFCHIVTLDHGLKLFKLYECQKQKVRVILDNRKVVLMEGRQQGKTITSAACILWYTLFQESKTVAILANKGSAAREVLDRYQIMYEHLPMWMQQGVRTWNKGNVELENGSKVFTAATTGSGIRGKSVNWLYIDEAAIIPNNVAEQFFASVYPTISAGTTTKILLTSTPLGYNHFWKFWNEAEKGKNGFISHFIPYWEIPGRDEEWAEEQRKTLGEVKFNQEVLCEFLGSSNTLINGRTLSQMSSIDPIFYNDMGLHLYQEPQKDRIYVITVDVARGMLVGRFKNNTIAPMLFPDVIVKTAKDYNNAFILVETNDIGGQIADILHVEHEYENILTTIKENNQTYISPGFAKTTTLGVRTTKSVKRQGCFAIKSLLEEKKLNIFDADTIHELSTFVEKNGTYMADEGYHDDLVMTLVLFGWLSTNQYFKELTDVNVRERIYKQQMLQIEDELTPFGFVDTGNEEPTFVENNIVWSTDRKLPWNELYDR